MFGHNQPSFDEVVQDSLARGLLLTIKDAYTTLSRDPRAEKRHFRVLAEVINCLNFNEIDAKGMAWPGRKYLARQSADAMRPDGYSEATIAKTIAELLAWGYLAQDRRAPPSGGRAISHYTVRKPSIEDLKAEIDAWVRAQRQGASKRPFPDKKGSPASVDGERPLSVSSSADEERPLFVGPPDGELPLSVNHGERPLSDRANRADGECVLPADGEYVLPTVTSSKRTSSNRPSASPRSGGSSSRPDDRPGLDPKLQPAAAAAPVPDEAELAVAFYNEQTEKHHYQRCTKLTPELRGRLEKRLRGIGGLDSWKRAVLAVPRHRFLSGRARPRDGDDRPFKLTIQILLRTQTSKGEPWDVLAELLDLAEDTSDHHPADATAQAERDEMEATYRRLAEEDDRRC